MATATSVKASRNNLDLRLLGRANSSGGSFDITCNDPSRTVIFVECTTSSTGNLQFNVQAGTTGTAEWVAEGIGDFIDRTTGGAGGGEQYSLGPFEGARFLDTSTGGRLITVRVGSTTGGSSTGVVVAGHKISVVEIVSST